MRKREGRTLRAAAQDLGVAASHLSRLERGQRTAGGELVDRIGRYYGLTPDELLLLGERVPADIAAILLAHPEELSRLRSTYVDDVKSNQ